MSPTALLRSPSAVIFAAHPWSGIPYGFHHIARALARLGWQVLYVEPHFSLLHIIGGRRRGRVFNGSPRPAAEPGIAVLSPFTFLPHANLPLLRSATTLNATRYASWPPLNAKWLEGTPFEKPDLVLCGSPVAAGIALSLGAGKSVYRLADDSSLFDVLSTAARDAEARAISQFDSVIVTSDALAQRARQFAARDIVLVSNGVDRTFFEQPSRMPHDLERFAEPRILYAGAVESWFDWGLVAQAARERPSFTFIIIGRVGAPPPHDIPGNVHILGQRAYSDMPAYMQTASVGIIPFASSEHDKAVRAINPLKLYEYLAAGCPVVSSIRPPNLDCEALFIYEKPNDFLASVDKALELRRHEAKIRAPEHVDWSCIVRGMLDDLNLTTPEKEMP